MGWLFKLNFKNMEDKKLSIKKKFFIGLGIMFLSSVLVVIFLVTWLYKTEHKECIKDEYDGRVLVEYYDIDTNIAKLEFIENGESKWIKHPNCCMEMSPLICGDEIKLDKGDENKIIVNGESFLIEFISEEEAEELGRISANKMFQDILNKE